jgi:hypothetical protein
LEAAHSNGELTGILFLEGDLQGRRVGGFLGAVSGCGVVRLSAGLLEVYGEDDPGNCHDSQNDSQT